MTVGQTVDSQSLGVWALGKVGGKWMGLNNKDSSGLNKKDNNGNRQGLNKWTAK